MQVGMMMVFASYGWEHCPDARVWDEEIRLARLTADLGFDCLWWASTTSTTTRSCPTISS